MVIATITNPTISPIVGQFGNTAISTGAEAEQLA